MAPEAEQEQIRQGWEFFLGWELGFFELLSITGEFPARFSGEKFPLGAAGSLLVLGKGVLAVPLLGLRNEFLGFSVLLQPGRGDPCPSRMLLRELFDFYLPVAALSLPLPRPGPT